MAQVSRVITVGVIGCGRVTETRQLPALRDLAGIHVLAAADIDKVRAERMGDQFRVERRYDGAAALLADPDVEAVAVCVPARCHAEVVLAALGAGKHVLVEKPLAVSLDDAERMSRRARAFPGTVMVGFNIALALHKVDHVTERDRQGARRVAGGNARLSIGHGGGRT